MKFKKTLKRMECSINSYELELDIFSDPDADATLKMKFIILKALLEMQEQEPLLDQMPHAAPSIDFFQEDLFFETLTTAKGKGKPDSDRIRTLRKECVTNPILLRCIKHCLPISRIDSDFASFNQRLLLL